MASFLFGMVLIKILVMSGGHIKLRLRWLSSVRKVEGSLVAIRYDFYVLNEKKKVMSMKTRQLSK